MTDKQQAQGSFECLLQDSVEIQQGKLDALFVALLLTSFGSFVAGNILLLDAEVLKASALMLVPCIGVLVIFCAASRLLGGLAWGIVTTLALVFLLVWLRQGWVVPLFYALALAASGYAAMRIRPKGVAWPGILLMAALGVATSFSAYSLFDYFDNLNVAKAGLIHKDVFFHSAIAAMVKNYGVVSTGLHGLVETPYYVMTHYLVALLSLASGRGVFEVFGVLTFVFLAPLLIFCTSACAVIFSGNRRLSVEVCWAAVCLMFVVPQAFLAPWAVSAQFLMSESYALSMCMFVLGLPLLLKHVILFSDIVLVVLLTITIAYTKASTAVIFSGLWAARWLVLGRARGKRELVTAILSMGIAALFVFKINAVSAGSGKFGILDYIRTCSWKGNFITLAMKQLSTEGATSFSVGFRAIVALGSFFIFHFLLSWLFLGQLLWRGGYSVLWRSPLAVTVWASVLGGALFVFLFASFDPNGIYWFSHPAFFVALPALAAIIALSLQHTKTWRMHAMLIASITVVCLLSYRSFYKNSCLSRLHSAKHESVLIDALAAMRTGAPLNAVMRAGPETWQLRPVLWESLYHIGLVKTRGDWLKDSWQTAAPLVYPAISERPWIGVIGPDKGKSIYDRYEIGYGYSSYAIDKANGGVLSPPVLLPGMTVLEWKMPSGANH